jgi:hypothetical protein
LLVRKICLLRVLLNLPLLLLIQCLRLPVLLRWLPLLFLLLLLLLLLLRRR